MTVRSIAQAAAGFVPPAPYWDLSTATYNGSPRNWYYLNTTFSEDTFFKPDGTRFYLVHRYTFGQVRQYDLSTAWELGTASPSGTVNVNTQDATGMTGLYFKPDGTKFYTTGYVSDAVHEYDMSTAWDVTTASHNQSLSVSSQTTAPVGVFMRDNGTRLFVVDSSYIIWYNLSTAWDISTASLGSQVYIYTSGPTESLLRGLYFKDDGTRFFTNGVNTDLLKTRGSTAWTPSSPTYYSSWSLDLSSIEGNARGVSFGDSGSKLFISGLDNDAILRFDMSTAWTPSTASFAAPTSDYLDVRPYDNTPQDIFFKPDGTEVYVYGYSNNKIYQWYLSTPWDLSSKIYRGAYMTGTTAQFSGFCIGAGGTKMFLVKPSNTLIYTYNMSSAWYASTLYNAAIYFDVSTWDSDPRDVAFSDDGYKMYLLGGTGKAITEFSLSTAWNVSTASATGNTLSVSQNTKPVGFYFGNDGYQIFTIDETSYSSKVVQYDLTTSWDLSTASYSKQKTFSSDFRLARGIHIRDDNGSKLYTLGGDLKSLLSYDMG